MCLVGALNDQYVLKAASIGQLKSTASRICNRRKTLRDRLKVTGDTLDTPIVFYRKNSLVGFKHYPGKWVKEV